MTGAAGFAAAVAGPGRPGDDMMTANRRSPLQPMLSYIAFPPESTLLARLRRIDGTVTAERERLYRRIAETLASRTLDSAAFSFLLIELLHRHSGLVGGDLGEFLPRCILALTGDRELSEAARAAFEELGRD